MTNTVNMGHRKVIRLDEHFTTGENTVQPVLLWGANGRPIYDRSKTASEATDYIRAVTPQPGKTIVLVLALGSYEIYDLNRNADGFNERPYRDGFKPTCGCCDYQSGGWIKEDETILHHYKSFEQGHNYRHHQNKDPDKRVGDVIKAFWNPVMHRVELLVGLDNDKAPDLAQQIADGAYPAVSMGCRIRYDVCTECGHRAPTRDKYCDHLKYHLREVGPKGLRYGALNPAPRWFDISWVIKPADQTGFMMKKVADVYEIRTAAEEGEYLDRVDEKRAAIQKVSDIDKVMRGIPVDHKTSPLSAHEARTIERYRDTTLPHVLSGMKPIDDATLAALAQHPLPDVLSTMTAGGVILSMREMMKLIGAQLAPGQRIPEEALEASVAMQGHIFELFAQHPQMLDQIVDTGIFDINAKRVRPEIAEKAEHYLEKRSTIGDYLTRNLVPAQFRPEEPPWTDTLHVRDPSTDTRYTTNRGAAVSAHDEIAKRQLMKMVGGSALLAGAYKLLAPGIPKVLRPLAAGTAAVMGYKHLRPDWGPQFMTEEGIPISTLTELQKESAAGSSVALPALGTAALVTALGHDYDSKLRQGQPRTGMIGAAGQYASENPTLSFLAGLVSYGMAKQMLNKFSSSMGDLDGNDVTDGVRLPSINIDHVAEKFGSVVVG